MIPYLPLATRGTRMHLRKQSDASTKITTLRKTPNLLDLNPISELDIKPKSATTQAKAQHTISAIKDDKPNNRRERHVLEREKLQLSREARAEERAYWTDVQPLTREDRDIHKALLVQDHRKKRIDELL